MNNMTFLFLIIIVVMGIFLAWTYTTVSYTHLTLPTTPYV